MSTEPAPIETRQAIAARDRSRPGKITGRLRKAIDLMVWSGARRAEAAERAGLKDHSLRAALKRPHVLRHYHDELLVLRESERARNVFALVDVRDFSANSQARVNAVKVLEQIADEAEAAPHRRPTAGVTIIIGHRPTEEHPPQRPTIDNARDRATDRRLIHRRADTLSADID